MWDIDKEYIKGATANWTKIVIIVFRSSTKPVQLCRLFDFASDHSHFFHLLTFHRILVSIYPAYKRCIYTYHNRCLKPTSHKHFGSVFVYVDKVGCANVSSSVSVCLCMLLHTNYRTFCVYTKHQHRINIYTSRTEHTIHITHEDTNLLLVHLKNCISA